MGYKNVKEHYDIKHTVEVCNEEKYGGHCICIGSPYIHDIIVIRIQDAKIVKQYKDGKYNDGWNTNDDVDKLVENLDPDVWECTLSVICEKDNTVKNAIKQKLQLITDFSERMKAAGYSIRVFNPAGQDDIGGGCGQLWYFQNWLKKQEKQETVDYECTNSNPYGLKEHREGCVQHCDDCDYYQPIEREK